MAERRGERTIARRRREGTVALAVALAPAAACGRRAGPPVEPGRSAVALSGGPNASMAYVARAGGRVLVVDLGWWGGEAALRRALAAVGAAPGDVADVFLTHAHRDHVGAWPLVRGARVHVGAPEVALLAGRARPGGWIPRWAERVRRSRLPRGGELDVRPFAADTAFAFGTDTLRAYVVPGHTAGSAAYLFRGTLFLGDAATRTLGGGFGPARRGYSDDAEAAARALAALVDRLPAGAVRVACTAHAHCAPFTPALRAALARGR